MDRPTSDDQIREVWRRSVTPRRESSPSPIRARRSAPARVAFASGVVAVASVLAVYIASNSGSDTDVTTEPEQRASGVQEVPFPHERYSPQGFAAAGEALVAVSFDEERGVSDEVIVSVDHGETWDAPSLPGAPSDLGVSFSSPMDLGGWASLSSQVPYAPGSSSGSVHVWVTQNGTDWNGATLTDVAPEGASAQIARVGDRLFASVTADRALQILYSDDVGVTWHHTAELDLQLQAAEIAELSSMEEAGDRIVGHAGFHGGTVTINPGDPPRTDERDSLVRVSSTDDGLSWTIDECAPVHDGPICPELHVAGSLLVAGNEASLDGGRNWHPIDAPRGPIPRTTLRSFSSLVALDDGWLATMVVPNAGAEPDVLLVTSDDGVTWHSVSGDLCPRGDETSAGENASETPSDFGSSFTPPVRHEDRWWISARHACEGRPAESVLLAIDDAGRMDLVDGTRREDRSEALRQPVVLSDRLIVPVSGEAGLISLLVIT